MSELASRMLARRIDKNGEDRRRERVKIREYRRYRSRGKSVKACLALRADMKTPETSSGVLNWWPGAESNRRHADFQSAALPTELPGQKRPQFNQFASCPSRKSRADAGFSACHPVQAAQVAFGGCQHDPQPEQQEEAVNGNVGIENCGRPGSARRTGRTPA